MCFHVSVSICVCTYMFASVCMCKCVCACVCVRGCQRLCLILIQIYLLIFHFLWFLPCIFNIFFLVYRYSFSIFHVKTLVFEVLGGLLLLFFLQTPAVLSVFCNHRPLFLISWSEQKLRVLPVLMASHRKLLSSRVISSWFLGQGFMESVFSSVVTTSQMCHISQNSLRFIKIKLVPHLHRPHVKCSIITHGKYSIFPAGWKLYLKAAY